MIRYDRHASCQAGQGACLAWARARARARARAKAKARTRVGRGQVRASPRAKEKVRTRLGYSDGIIAHCSGAKSEVMRIAGRDTIVPAEVLGGTVGQSRFFRFFVSYASDKWA